jgi:uncharacterized membrane protein
MSPLAQLGLAMASFVGTHFLLSHPLRATLVARFGATGFLGIYSLVAAATLGWTYWVFRTLPVESSLWLGPTWLFDWVAPAIMLVAAILLAGSFANNPAFPNPDAEFQPVRPATGVFAITRHPMNWAFILWALVHIALSGSPANLIVASGILVLTFFGSMAQDRKKESLLGDAWKGWEARTSFIPFGAVANGRVPMSATWPGLVAIVGGSVIWIGASYLHTMTVGFWAWIS